MNTKVTIQERDAARIASWMQSRGGIRRWSSADLSDPEWGSITPAKDVTGEWMSKPHWKAASDPLHVTDPAEVAVVTAIRVKAFHVATRMGSQGLTVKVTDGGSNRIRREVAKAAEKHGHAWHEFDSGSYKNAVIMAAGKTITLAEWIESHKEAIA